MTINADNTSLSIYNLTYIIGMTVFIGNTFEMRLLNLRINFYLLRIFCPHLGRVVFFIFLFLLTMFRPNFTSGLLQVINRDLG